VSECATKHDENFLENAGKTFAMRRCRELLRGLLSGWPRRARSLLVMGAGSPEFVESLWEAGFDVTVQDNDQPRLERVGNRMGRRVECVLSASDHLPFDDKSFDYAAASPTLDFAGDPEAVQEEMGRVACGGVIFVFFNAWSVFGLECRARRSVRRAPGRLHSPRVLAATARNIWPGKKRAWASALPGPYCTWRNGFVLRRVNSLDFPLPLGAVAGLRVDFAPLYAGTPLVLRSGVPAVSSAEPYSISHLKLPLRGAWNSSRDNLKSKMR
jgi:hypothetical protein